MEKSPCKKVDDHEPHIWWLNPETCTQALCTGRGRIEEVTNELVAAVEQRVRRQIATALREWADEHGHGGENPEFLTAEYLAGQIENGEI